ARRTTRSADISTSITADVPIRVLTAARRIKPTSPRCHSAWQPNLGRGSTYRCGKSVQTTGPSSVANIHSSISGREQEMLVIYNNPVYHELIVKDGVFCKQRTYPDGWGNGVFVYSNKALQHSRLHRSLS